MLFCKTLIDYASNEPKVREVIRELETMFPASKQEEAGGLSQHFNNNVEDGKDENKKTDIRGKKKGVTTTKGKDAQVTTKGLEKGGGGGTGVNSQNANNFGQVGSAAGQYRHSF